MKAFQICMTTVGWQPVPIRSHSEQGRIYTVHVNPWRNDDESICECPGYIHRGKCSHQKEAAATICRWHQLINTDIPQTKEQKRIGQCPKCGGPTLKQCAD